MADNIISIENLSKKFGEETVLKNISHKFERGKIHGVVGFNGSGKTVLFKCICGFVLPTTGKIVVNGKCIGKDTDFPESTGIIIENPGFLPNFTGLQNLNMLADVNGYINHEKVRTAIRMVGLDPDSPKNVGKYSLGMRERLGIAQALMEEPELLILDEPFNGLDKNGVRDIYRLLLEQKDMGNTILLASHNEENIQVLCDTVCEIELGVLRRIK